MEAAEYKELVEKWDQSKFDEIVRHIHCPFDLAPSPPMYEEIFAETKKWMQDFGLITTSFNIDNMLTYLKYCSVGKNWSRERVRLFSDWLVFIFCIDDIFVEEAGTYSDSISLSDIFFNSCKTGEIIELDSLTSSNNPLDLSSKKLLLLHNATRLIADLRSRLLSITDNLTYFFNESITTFQDTRIESYIKAKNLANISIFNYIDLRRGNGALLPIIEIASILSEIALPDNERRDAVFIFLRNRFCDHGGVINDIFSLKKDLKTGNVENIVLVIYKEQKLKNLSDAILQAVLYSNNIIEVFLKLEEGLNHTEGMNKYVDMLKAFMKGNVATCIESNRYH